MSGSFIPTYPSIPQASIVLLVIELRFNDSISAVDVRKAVRRLEADIKARYPEIKYVFFGSAST